MSGPRVVLVGPPGAGKTTVGRSLAQLWGATFCDTDHEIESTVGLSVADIFVSRGEAVFRDLERATVASALSTVDGVLALGAGAVLDASTRTALRRHLVVHLDVGLRAAMSRLDMNRSRPLLLGNVRTRWQTLSEERRPLYRDVARFTVATDELTPDAVAETIAERLAAAGLPGGGDD